MMMASASFKRAKSVVAAKCRLLTNCWIFVCGICSIYDLPAFNIFTLLGSVSNPVTLCPASAKRSASGKPTYPQPMIATLSCAPLKNSGFRSMAICYFLLLVILPRAAWSQRNRVFGDPASPAALILGQSQQDTRLMQQRQVNIAG